MKKSAPFVFSIAGFLLTMNVAFCQALPQLKSGKSLRNTLFEDCIYRHVSGYAILEFRINKDGKVDSSRVTSKYYTPDKDSTKRWVDTKDHTLLRSLEFEPQQESVWVQCKVYIYFYNDSIWNIDDLKGLETMRKFDYGFKALWKNEIETYFIDSAGKLKEHIILNNRLIVAPIYIFGQL